MANPEEMAAEVMGRIPSGCSVLTAIHEGRSSGMLASWLQQASLEPLLVSVAVRNGRPILPLMDGSGRFVLNLLGGDTTAIFKHFGGGFAPDQSAFEGLPSRQTPFGVVLEAALGYLECTLESKIQAGDHWLVVGRPVSGGFEAGDKEPYVHIRKTAISY